jgi:large subunit ribosomal protein L9
VRVKPGYARNFLFPRGIAVEPTKDNLRLVEKDKAAEAVVEAERAKVRAELAAKLSGQSVTIEAKANPEGHLFGSVGPKQVADALVAKGFEIEERQVRLEPVKQLGEYEVKIHLAPDAEPAIKLWVVEELAEGAEKGEKPEKAEKPARAEKAEKPEKGAGSKSAK